jgi:hypothetical protein
MDDTKLRSRIETRKIIQPTSFFYLSNIKGFQDDDFRN